MRSIDPSDYVFFWKPSEPKHGWASQWYHSPFIQGDNTFITCEHWMMYQKALLFDDTAVAQEVLSIARTDEASMRKVKGLGRKVKPFDEETWNEHRERIVYEGNLLKFRQNPNLKRKLLSTGEREMVEASPRDRIWGIGFGEVGAFKEENIDRWGENLLGKALMRVRDELRSGTDEH